jgi:hypothetical protein
MGRGWRVVLALGARMIFRRCEAASGEEARPPEGVGHPWEFGVVIGG